MPLDPALRFAALPSERFAFTVIAIDPGVTTGWALFAIDKKAMADPSQKLLSHVMCWRAENLEGDENAQASTLLSLLRSRPSAHVVVEDFTLRKFTRDRELLSPVRIAAKLDYGMYLERREIAWQQPSLAMSTLTDERLKGIGLWDRLSAHQRDAIRHALTYLRRARS
jgi:hypothetical protein